MRIVMACVVLAAWSGRVQAQSGSSFVTNDGINRAPAAVLHCVNANNIAVPCGTSGQPLYVTGSGGLANAASQSLQVTAGQSVASAAGTQQDAAYSGGAGSMIALLKGIVGELSAGVTAEPVAGVPISRSASIPAASSVILFPTSASRHYIAVQAPTTTLIWVNFVGGTAAPNGVDCVQLSAGTLYESGPFVTRGSIAVYAPVAVSISAWEG